MVDKMIQNLEEKSGKTLKQWLSIVKKSGLSKHMQIVKYLKDEHGLTHGYANLIVHKSKDSAETKKPEGDLVASQYSKGKEDLKPIYDELVKQISKFGKDIEIAPKKAYVSIRRKTQFAIIQPSTKTRIDLGLKLKGTEITDRLENSGSFNSMVSHRVRITNKKDINKELKTWLKMAYDNAG